MKKRVMSFVLMLVIIIGLLPTLSQPASAANNTTPSYNFKLTGDLAQDIINVAKAQDGKNLYDYFGDEWCAYFACWAGKTAGANFPPNPLPDGKATTAWFVNNSAGEYYCFTNKNYTSIIGAVKSHKELVKRVDRGSFTPRKGDLVMFLWEEDATKWNWSHVGIVESYDRNKKILHTVEGNTSNSIVASKTRDYDSEVVGIVRPYYCNHSYIAGYCTKCKTYMPYKSVEDVAAYYKVKQRFLTLAERPYINISGSQNVNYGTVFGQVVEATQKVTNGLGEVWYKVIADGKTGYIKESNLTYYKAVPSDVTCSNGKPTSPRTLKKGSSYAISGLLTAKGCTITSIAGQIISSATGKAVQRVKTYSVGHAQTYNIKGKQVDTNLKFGKLDVGTYTYEITATTSTGITKTFVSDPFTVTDSGKSICASPTFRLTPYVGGVKVTLSSATSGATINYSYNGKNATGTTPVTFNLTKSATVTATALKSGMNNSAASKQTITVTNLSAPEITSNPSAKGVHVTISGPKDAMLYYSINDETFQRYTGIMTFTSDAKITAYAEKSGCTTSDRTSFNVVTRAPATPYISLLSTKSDVAVGTAMNVQWDKIEDADSYVVETYLDGEFTHMQEVYSTSATIPTVKEGIYTVYVAAKNYAGESAKSRAVSVTAHAPVTVTFLRDDGSELTKQTVRYGENATAPAAPLKVGYTFTGWSENLKNIKSNMTIRARYEINHYTVRFYDINGTTLLGKQIITYNEGINSAEMEAKVNLEVGNEFVGWHISEASPNSQYDLQHIDSDMSLVATQSWAIEDLPVVIQITDAKRNANCTGYDVNMQISCAPAKTIGGDTQKIKVIVTLKSDENQMLASSMETINLTENTQNLSRNIFVSYDGSDLAKQVEASAVGIDGNDRTGGTLSAIATATPTVTTNYSAWVTEAELNSKGISVFDSGVQSKVQYRYKDYTRNTTSRTTTQSTAPSITGYTLVSQSSVWGDWSTWSDTVVSSTANREVQTQSVQKTAAYKEYRYGRWQSGSGNSYCSATCKKYYGGTPVAAYTGWSKTRYKIADTSYTCGNISGYTHKHFGSIGTKDGVPLWNMYTSDGTSTNSSKRYWWEESRTIAATYKTQYRYRDKIFTYNYEKWTEGNFSDWTDTVYTAYSGTNSRRTVETRNLYRYVVSNTSVVDMPSNVQTYSISGRLPCESDFSDKLATVMAYKQANSDPTEPQMEYIGQVRIGAGNSYDISFKPKENPTTATGDFIVALALQGSSNVVNIDKIDAPAEQYTVNFLRADGTILSTQTVEEGEDAQIPNAPDMDGFDFVGWDKDSSAVNRDMEISPIYWPKTYSVVIVDHENETVQLRTDYSYGELLKVSFESGDEDPAAPGMLFEGWQVISNATGEVVDTDLSDFAVTEDLIVKALWSPITYKVTFTDEQGNSIKDDLVKHGAAAEPPELKTVPSDMEFLGWSTESTWWNVTENITVHPILVYKANTAAPLTNLETYIESTYQELEITAEDDATIYYTLDGSTPLPENVQNREIDEGKSDGEYGLPITYEYTEPIELTESTVVTAIAVADGKNTSEEIQIIFNYSEGQGGWTDDEEAVEIGTYNVYVTPGEAIKLQFNIANNPGLAGYMFLVNGSPDVFGIVCDEENNPSLETGAVCKNQGTALLGNYEDDIGWRVLWFGTEPCEGTGTLCTLEMQVCDNVESGLYPIKVSYVPSNTITNTEVEASADDMQIAFFTDTETLLGDVNGDGYITAVDVVRIARYIINDFTFTETQRIVADVTGDNRVTAADVIRLARYLVGLAELG